MHVRKAGHQVYSFELRRSFNVLATPAPVLRIALGPKILCIRESHFSGGCQRVSTIYFLSQNHVSCQLVCGCASGLHNVYNIFVMRILLIHTAKAC